MKKTLSQKLLDFGASHGLTVVALLFLMILTIVGTIDQKYIGLYQAQKKYFDSAVAHIQIFETSTHSFYLPVPGGFTVMSVLFVNLILAFVLKFKFRWRSFGLWVSHLGFMLLLVGSFITFQYSQDGHVSIFEKEQASSFTSYHDNEMLVKSDGQDYEDIAVIPQSFLTQKKLFASPDFDIQIKIIDYYKNSDAKLRNLLTPDITQVVHLDEIDMEIEHEKNQQGVLIEVLNYKGEKVGDFSVFLNNPLEFNYRGKSYTILLRRLHMGMPFTVRLEKFVRETYPGTETPKRFESTVTVLEEGQEREVVISMNKPLRHKGFTLFQSAFATTENGQYQSTLAVVRNPAEAWPYFSCLFIFLGMVIHFIPKLFRFVKRRNKENG